MEEVKHLRNLKDQKLQSTEELLVNSNSDSPTLSSNVGSSPNLAESAPQPSSMPQSFSNDRSVNSNEASWRENVNGPSAIETCVQTEGPCPRNTKDVGVSCQLLAPTRDIGISCQLLDSSQDTETQDQAIMERLLGIQLDLVSAKDQSLKLSRLLQKTQLSNIELKEKYRGESLLIYCLFSSTDHSSSDPLSLGPYCREGST